MFHVILHDVDGQAPNYRSLKVINQLLPPYFKISTPHIYKLLKYWLLALATVYYLNITRHSRQLLEATPATHYKCYLTMYARKAMHANITVKLYVLTKQVQNEAAVACRWQKGDITMVDNLLTQHSRNHYTPPRRIYISLFKE